MRLRTKLLCFAAAVLLCLGVAFVGTSLWYLKSERFQEDARRLAVQRLQQATGLTCSIARLRINPFRLSFHVWGLVLHSPPEDRAVSNIRVEEVSGSVRLRSLTSFRVSLTDLDLLRPRVTLVSAGEKSQWHPEEFLKAYRTSLDLEAGQVSLRDGWLEVNNRRVPFDVALRNLACEIKFLPQVPAYRIRLAFQNGKLQWAGKSFAYDVDARATVLSTGVDVESIAFRYGKSQFSGNGWMRDWNSPVVLFHAAGPVAGEDLSLFDENLRFASGAIQVTANFRWDLAGFRATARFSAPSGSYRKVAMKSIQGLAALEKGVLTLSDVKGQIGEGPFQARASFHLLPSDPAPHLLEVGIRGLVLRDAAALLDVPGIAYGNAIDGSARLSWRKGRRDLELASELHLGEPLATTQPAGMSTNLRGDVSLQFSRGAWLLSSADLSSPDTELQVAGGGRSGFQIRLRTRRAKEILGMLPNLFPWLKDTLARYPDLMDVSGSYELRGDVILGSTGEFSYQGLFHLVNGKWRAYSLDNLSSRAAWNGKELDLQSLTLQKAAGSASGNLKLIMAEQEGQPPQIYFQGAVRDWALTSLKEVGIDPGEDAAGVLSGDGSISEREGVWQGEGSVSIERGRYKGQDFDSLRGFVRLRQGTMQIAESQLIRGAAKLAIRGDVQLAARAMDLTVRLEDLPLRSLPAVREDKVDVDGTISASGRVRGTFENPNLTGSLELEGLRYAAWDLGRGKGSIELKDKILTGEGVVRSDLGSFRVHAAISTEPGYAGKAKIELRDWNVRKLITARVPPYLRDLSTALQGTVEIAGSFSDPALLNYRAEMDGTRFKFHDYELSNSGKIRFTIAKRGLHIAEGDATVIGEGTRLVLRGDIPLDEGPTLDLRLDGNLNLKMLAQMEKRVQVAGSADLSVRATGTVRNPQVIGQSVLKDVRLEHGDWPFRCSGIQGNLVFSRNLVRLENVQGSVASGTFRLSGALEQQNAELRGINLQLSARGVRFSYPKDFRSTADADLTLRGSLDSPVLAGDVHVIRSDYQREFNLLEQLAVRGTAFSGPLASDPFLVGLRLNIGIHSEEGLHVDNELTRLRGSMRLTLSGTPAFPSLAGRIEATEGSIFFRGNRFDIVRGSADFMDRNRINPVLDVRAEADVRSYRLLLDVNGDLDHLRFNISSDPPMSMVDILTLLTTGKERDPGEINSRRQTEITGLSAASILSENITGVVGKRVQRLFGLQTFRVDPFLAGAENDPTARVTIIERVSKDLTITFSQNLSTNEEQIINFEYQVSKNLSLLGTRNERSELGLDFRFRMRFR